MTTIRGEPSGAGARVAVVTSRFNEQVTERLAAAARACLLEHGVPEDAIDSISVPGAFELPAAAARALRTGRYDALVVLGCVIRGETPHFDFVAGEATRSVGTLALEADVPIGFGLLTTEDGPQALARAGGARGNKGWEAAEAALEMLGLFRALDGHAVS